MSTQPEQQTPAPTVVDSSADDRLAQLHAQYADLKAAADEAASRFKACTDAIKYALQQRAAEGAQKITLVGNSGPALALTYTERWTIDSRKLKAEDPLTYVKYAKKGGSWSLRVAQGGEES